MIRLLGFASWNIYFGEDIGNILKLATGHFSIEKISNIQLGMCFCEKNLSLSYFVHICVSKIVAGSFSEAIIAFHIPQSQIL